MSCAWERHPSLQDDRNVNNPAHGVQRDGYLSRQHERNVHDSVHTLHRERSLLRHPDWYVTDLSMKGTVEDPCLGNNM